MGTKFITLACCAMQREGGIVLVASMCLSVCLFKN